MFESKDSCMHTPLTWVLNKCIAGWLCVSAILTVSCMLAGHLMGGGVAGVGVQAPWQRP